MFFKKRKNQEDSLRQLEDQFAALSQNAAAAKDSLEYLQGLRQEFGGVAQASVFYERGFGSAAAAKRPEPDSRAYGTAAEPAARRCTQTRHGHRKSAG